MAAVKPCHVSRAETRRAVQETLDTLATVPCTFWACDGPDKPTVHMKTCTLCYQIKRLRVLAARLSGPGPRP
jgi:hypothetical protein